MDLGEEQKESIRKGRFTMIPRRFQSSVRKATTSYLASSSNITINGLLILELAFLKLWE